MQQLSGSFHTLFFFEHLTFQKTNSDNNFFMSPASFFLLHLPLFRSLLPPCFIDVSFSSAQEQHSKECRCCFLFPPFPLHRTKNAFNF